MSRVQLALNVTDLDAAIAFYGRLFGAEPHKRRPGYANFALDDPALKLVLIESSTGGSLNHLGVEVSTTGEVAAATDRLAAAGLDTDVRDQELCCHAVQDKVWVTDPDGAPWEVYTITDDQPDELPTVAASACCS
jgi:catechol 2,3-dioxygenase-like lactoylglutathione lyase family enzyme